MMGTTLKTLLLALVAAIFAVGSMVEAAPKKNVKTRVKRPARVSSTTSPTPSYATKKPKAGTKRAKKPTSKTKVSATPPRTTKPR